MNSYFYPELNSWESQIIIFNLCIIFTRYKGNFPAKESMYIITLHVHEIFWIFFRKAINRFEVVILGVQGDWAHVLAKKTWLPQLKTGGQAPNTPKSMTLSTWSFSSIVLHQPLNQWRQMGIQGGNAHSCVFYHPHVMCCLEFNQPSVSWNFHSQYKKIEIQAISKRSDM